MDVKRAKEIIYALSQGIDPITGEVLPDDCVCNKSEVVRAFYTILNDNPVKEKSEYENYGKPWSFEDDKLLTKMFESGATKTEMQKHFKRSPGSIRSRLVKLNLIDD